MCFRLFLSAPFLLWPLLTGGLCHADEKASAPEKEEARSPEHVFESGLFLDEYRRIQIGVAVAFRQRNLKAAESLLQRAIEIAPGEPGDYYNLACARARMGNLDAALDDLENSVTLGFLDANHMMADSDLRPLYPFSRFHAQVSRARWIAKSIDRFAYIPPGGEPAMVQEKVALVGESNTVFRFRQGLYSTYFTFPESLRSENVAKGLSKARRLLRSWYEEGTAAGNVGDLYDNWDRDHSNLDYDQFPQLTRVEYASAAKRAGLGMGIQLQVFHNAITIGNSSTAQVGSPYWRSQPRGAYARPGGAAILHAQYRSNHLYFYPEHRDHDPGHNGEKDGYGDVFPANTPYVVISQGSSGSDRPFLEAFAATLAAFRPEVKSQLKSEGLIVPTLQMVFRRSNRNVRNRADYLTARAHPTVFDSLNVNAKAMVEKANAIKANELPPLVRLSVLEEDESPGTPSEKIFDTPQAIARVFHNHRYSRTMKVSAEKSLCPQESDLKFHWKVLRGDASRIQITPQNEEASVVEIEIPYHQRFPISEGSELFSNRVDIGAFVENEHHVSAPAFISTYFLDNEVRVYDTEQKLLSIDGNDPDVRENYVDPLIAPRKQWRDELHYDNEKNLTGWTRHFSPDGSEEYTADGKRIVVDKETGTPRLENVRYIAKTPEDGKSLPFWQVMDTEETATKPPNSDSGSN